MTVPSKAMIRDHGYARAMAMDAGEDEMTMAELVEATRAPEVLDVCAEVIVPMENGDVDIVQVWGTSYRDCLDNALVAYCVDCVLLVDEVLLNSARA